MPDTLRIALGQFAAALGDVEHNLGRIRELLERAAAGGAALACFPELGLSGYLLDRADYTDALLDAVEEAERVLAADARRLNLSVIYGTPARAGDVLNNLVVHVEPDGTRLAYAKTHMDVKELAVFTPGEEFVIAPGGVGLACCYDLAFPEAGRLLALRGARALIVPMAWEVGRGYVMQRVAPARAVENVLYVACVNQAGAAGELRFLGSSCVLNPLGQVEAAFGSEQGVLFADVDLAWADRLRDGSDRRNYPLLDDRRPELYAELYDSSKRKLAR